MSSYIPNLVSLGSTVFELSCEKTDRHADWRTHGADRYNRAPLYGAGMGSDEDDEVGDDGDTETLMECTLPSCFRDESL